MNTEDRINMIRSHAEIALSAIRDSNPETLATCVAEQRRAMLAIETILALVAPAKRA